MAIWGIPAWCGEVILMQWYQDASYVDGVWTYANFQQKTITASVQNPSSNTRDLTPEGYQESETRVIFTTEASIPLIRMGGQDSCFFMINGEPFFMIKWERWNYLMPHYRVTVVGKNGMPYNVPFESSDGWRFDAWSRDAWYGVV